MKKQKIAMFGHKRIPSREGGIEVVVEQLATRMAAAGNDVICYNRAGHHVSGNEFDTKADENYKGVKIKVLPTIDKKGLAAVTSSFFGGLITAFSKAEIVHIHAEGPAAMCWIPKLTGKKVVVTVHGLDWQREKWKSGFGSKYIRFGEKMAVKFADEIIVLSKGVQNYFLQTYGRKTLYIPNGVEKPVIKEAEAIKEKFGLEKDSYILFLGRIVPEKGLHYLIEGFKNVRTDKKLVIAGGASDSDGYMNQVKAMAADDTRIMFTGFVQGQILEELYSNAYVYVLPSDVEGMPLSLLEAMSYSNCCLVSDIDECTEVVEKMASVFEKGCVESLTAKLQQLCNNQTVVGDYKRNAADYICRKYNWDDVTWQTINVYTGKGIYNEDFDGEQVFVS